jgi:hypothetical protein
MPAAKGKLPEASFRSGSIRRTQIRGLRPTHPPRWRSVIIISVDPALPPEPELSIERDGRGIIQPDHQAHGQHTSPPQKCHKVVHEGDSNTAASMRRNHGDGVEFSAGRVVDGERVPDDGFPALRDEKQTVLPRKIVGEPRALPGVATKRRSLDPHDGSEVVAGRSPDAQSGCHGHEMVAELA